MELIFSLLCDKHHTSIFIYIALSFRIILTLQTPKNLDFLAQNLLEIFRSQDFEYYLSFITALDKASNNTKEFARVMTDTMIEFEAIQKEDAGLRKSQHDFLKNRSEMAKLKFLNDDPNIENELYTDLSD